MQDAISLVRCTTYDQQQADAALDRALHLIGGLDWVKPGMRIVVKPNLLMPKHPDAAGTTHPGLIDALLRQLTERGAQVIIGDSPGGPFSARLLKVVYDSTRMASLERDGVSLNYNIQSVQAANPSGTILKQVDVAEFIMKADAVISFAKLKTHTFMTYTGAVKNLFGVVPGTIKAEYHQRMSDPGDFARMLVDLAEFVRPRLSIIDGVIGMEGNGPSGGQPRPIGVIIASVNPHLADLIATALIGLKPEEVPTLKTAIGRGLCPASAEQVDVLGDDPSPLVIHDFLRAGQPSFLRGLLEVAIRKLIRISFQSEPEVDSGLCVGCRACEQACPPKAITMVSQVPQIDRKTCIRCFCCQELCPQSAIGIKRTRLARMLQPLKSSEAKDV
ncbi:MAG: DUF362 domain-containing protein [Bacillota bacterium]|nr:DUF362 domain-containing protein [Bacillota bacterium]